MLAMVMERDENSSPAHLVCDAVCEGLDCLPLPRVAELHHIHPYTCAIAGVGDVAKQDSVSVVSKVEVEPGGAGSGLQATGGGELEPDLHMRTELTRNGLPLSD